VDPTTGKQITTKTVKHYIPTDKGLREAELSAMIQQSTEAKEMIRTAFEIPELPPVEVVEQVEKENKKKRGKKSDADDDNETVIVETL
jgi:hypothetical protein